MARAHDDTDEVRKLTTRVVSANMRFAISIAAKYRFKGLDFLDLIQEAYLGLLRAVGKFEWQKECRFLTYAGHWIRQMIRIAIANQSGTIRFPVHIQEKWSKMRGAFEESVRNENGVEPTDEELAARLEWASDTIQKMRILFRSQWTLSLDAPIDVHRNGRDSTDTEFAEIVWDKTSPSLEEKVIAELTEEKVRETVSSLISALPPRTAEIIRRRFGFDGKEPQSLEEIGRVFGLSRERVRQIEATGLKQLKRPARVLKL